MRADFLAFVEKAIHRQSGSINQSMNQSMGVIFQLSEPDTVGPGSPHSVIAGNGMSTAAGGTRAIGSDGVRNHVTELAGPVQDS